MHGVGEKNDGLLPHHAALLVAHVVNLIVDHPGYFAENVAAAVQHASQNLRRHHQHRRVGVDRDISSHEAHVGELLLQIAVLLVAQRLDGGGVNDALVVAETHGDGVFGDGRLAGRCVGRDEHGLLALQAVDRLALERIQLVGVCLRGNGVHLHVVPRLVVAYS